jgi:hypothetical protein
MTFSTKPVNTQAGVPTVAAVTALDAAGNPVVGGTVNMVVNSGPGGFATGSTTGATTNALGVATFGNLVLTVGGSYTLKATDGLVNVTSITFTVNLITILSTAPSSAIVGGTYTPSASATSLDTVGITVDASSAGICSIGGANLVTFLSAGSCSLDFNDAGNGSYAAAAPATQTFSIATKTVRSTSSVLGIAPTPSKASTESNIVLTVTVTGASGAGNPLGTMQIKYNGVTECQDLSAAASGANSATFSCSVANGTFPYPGSSTNYSLTGVYTPDPTTSSSNAAYSYSTSTSPAVNFRVTGA